MADRMRQKKCKCCGTDYLYCFHCDADKNKPTWMMMFHDDNCRNIFQIITDFNANELSKKEAIDKLNNCDLSNRKSFLEPIQNGLNEIFGTKVSEEVIEKVEVVNKVDEAQESLDKPDKPIEEPKTIKSGDAKKTIKIQKK